MTTNLTAKWLKAAQHSVNEDAAFKKLGYVDTKPALKVGSNAFLLNFEGFSCHGVKKLSSKDLRDADVGDMNYDGVRAVLDGDRQPQVLSMEPGTLVLFRGRNSLHRVSPNESDTTRMLAVLAYNAEPGVELSESARMTFYGRLT